MSLSAAQAAAFVTEAKATGTVWTIRDEGGYPAPKNAEGSRAMPFWSKRSRVEKIIGSVPAYSGFEPEEISLQDFLDNWLLGLDGDGLAVGLNWYGKRVTGYHLSVADVRARFGLPAARPREIALAEPGSRLAKLWGWISSRAAIR